MPPEIKKLIRYYGSWARIQLIQFLEYRANAFSASLATYGYTFMTLLFFDVIFNNINSIAGWNHNEILLLFGMGQLIYYTYRTFFGATWRFISQIISKGKLDAFLLRPINSLFSIITSRLSLVEILPSWALAIGIVVVAWNRLELGWGWYQFATLTDLFLGVALFTAPFLAISLASFWWTDTQTLTDIYYSIIELQQYPAEIFPRAARPIFMTLIPITLTAYTPTYFLIRRFSPVLLTAQILVLIFFMIIINFLWKRGLERYSSVSG